MIRGVVNGFVTGENISDINATGVESGASSAYPDRGNRLRIAEMCTFGAKCMIDHLMSEVARTGCVFAYDPRTTCENCPGKARP